MMSRNIYKFIFWKSVGFQHQKATKKVYKTNKNGITEVDIRRIKSSKYNRPFPVYKPHLPALSNSDGGLHKEMAFCLAPC